MNATTAATAFTGMADFLTNARPGDTFTDHSDRSITTNIFIERTDPRTSDQGGMDKPNSLGGMVRAITTRHHGRDAHLAAPLSFRSVDFIEPIRVSPLAGGFTCISHKFRLGNPARVVGQVPAARFSRRKLEEVHAAALVTAGVNV